MFINFSVFKHLECTYTAQKMKFSINDFFSKQMWLNPHETADLGTFSEEILNGKIHFLCSAEILEIIN